MPDDEQNRRHLPEVLQNFDTAMFVTRKAEGWLRARPVSFVGELGVRFYFRWAEDRRVAE